MGQLTRLVFTGGIACSLLLAACSSSSTPDTPAGPGAGGSDTGGAGGSPGAGGGSSGKGGAGGAAGKPGAGGAGAGGAGGKGGTGGAGGVSGTGGTGGVSSTGGTGGTGGAAGASGSGGSGGGAPAGWTCDPKFYNQGMVTGALCDCNCGVPDPDCNLPGAIVAHCPKGESFCDASGKCAATQPVPAGWTCNPLFYGDGICHCDCGVPDDPASCANPAPPIAGCNPTQTGCDAMGKCTGGMPTPAGWTCKADFYGDGVCNCGCGIPDVAADCMGATAPFVGCNPTQTGCDANGACTGGTPTPAGWTCPPDSYGDGVCNCGCGVADLAADCMGATAPFLGCNPSNTGCDASGACTGGTPTPKTWTCSKSSFDEGPSHFPACDCNCGAYDPDCDLPGVTTLHCPDQTSTCDKSGMCTTPVPVPAGWTCSKFQFGDGVCDCGCGAADLPSDCANAKPPFKGCMNTQSCDAMGKCQGGTPVPMAWTCDPTTFGDGTCDCGCGAPDFPADCMDPKAAIHGCPSKTSSCDASGMCTPPVPPPAGWTCDKAKFGDGACDCGCGAADFPADCAGATAPINGCNPSNTGCDAMGKCTGGTPTPAGWTCPPDSYGDGVCDCGCGAPDLSADCMGAKAPFHGCNPSNTGCDASGACTGGTPTPKTWTCNPAFYGDGSCDCGCGGPDLAADCMDPKAAIHGCPSKTSSCDASGMCTPPVPPPAGWTCDKAKFGDGACDCGCGAADFPADCAGVTGFINGCNPTQTGCDAMGKCTGGMPTPAGWTCKADFYGDGVCNCGCGAPDLSADCAGATAPIAGCNPSNTGCDAMGKCTGGTPTPAGWTCPPDSYGDGVCDCGCGAPDLSADCMGAKAPFHGCNPSNTGCDASGACTGGTPTPKTWTCNPSYFDEGAGAGHLCDCNCGAHDPDCDMGLKVTGCMTSTQTCDNMGMCTGS